MANRHLDHLKTPVIRKGWIALGLVAMLVGGWLSYHLAHHPAHIGEHNAAFYQCLVGTILVSGLCLICGTAQWWLKK